MKNPIRTEAEAFSFVLVMVAVFGVVALAGWLGNGWTALAAFLAAGVGAWAAIYMRSGPEEPEPAVWERQPHPGPARILVIANETVTGGALRNEIVHRARRRGADVLVVCPALNSPLKHWASDDDGARTAAQERLEASLAALEQDGVAARGEVGDPDPLQAIEDGLRTFAADEVIISTHPPGRSNWLERNVVALARERYDIPISHVVVDLEHEAAAR